MSERAPIHLGWWLSSEEHSARSLVEQAVLAESIGIGTVMISDHLQPWVPAQGHAGQVWTTIGAIAVATERLEVGTGVTAMVHRNHPIVVAHAASTAAVLLEDRFFLGVGTGERLNEQVFGQRWPHPAERRQMLEEAIDIIRRLWGGEAVHHVGDHWRVEHLTVWERPAAPPPIYVAASGKRTARLAGTAGDGMIAVAPNAQIVDAYRGAGGTGPCRAQLHVCVAEDTEAALDLAWRWWPNGGIAPAVLPELARPEQFEAVAATTVREAMHESVVCATDAQPIVDAIDRYAGAGFDAVYIHQVGPNQQRLADLLRTELLPHYRDGG